MCAHPAFAGSKPRSAGIKHFEDFAEARDEKSSVMRACLYLRLFANIGADWAEDVCSLERIASRFLDAILNRARVVSGQLA